MGRVATVNNARGRKESKHGCLPVKMVVGHNFLIADIFRYQFRVRARVAMIAPDARVSRLRPMQDAPLSSDRRNEEFVRLFVENQRRVHAFIATLLPNLSDAEDVLQETSVTAWRKFDDFRSGTDFVRWACTIARLEVLKFRRQQKSGRLLFNDALVEGLADHQMSQSDRWDNWSQALADCLAKLRARIASCSSGAVVPAPR